VTVVFRGDDPPYPPMSGRGRPDGKNRHCIGPAPARQKPRGDRIVFRGDDPRTLECALDGKAVR
jgi:hypothetical protein